MNNQQNSELNNTPICNTASPAETPVLTEFGGKRPHPDPVTKSKKFINQGRWTPSENMEFGRGLKLYHKKWALIQTLVPSRSVTQIRSHAQKYFMKHKNCENSSTSSSNSSMSHKIPENSTPMAQTEIVSSYTALFDKFFQDIASLFLCLSEQIMTNDNLQGIQKLLYHIEHYYECLKQIGGVSKPLNASVFKNMAMIASKLNQAHQWYSRVTQLQEEFRRFKYLYSNIISKGNVNPANFSFLGMVKRKKPLENRTLSTRFEEYKKPA